MKGKELSPEWNPRLIERTGALVSNVFFSKISPGSRRRILEEQEGMGGLGQVKAFYEGKEVEVVRTYLLPRRCRRGRWQGPSWLAIRRRGEVLDSPIPLSRKVIRKIQLLRRPVQFT